MIEKRKWLLDDGGYHLDTSHLSATVKISTLLEEPEQIQKAWELCQYGRRLHHQFQYPGEEPFLDFYPAHLTFFSVLRGENVEAGLKMFQRKAQTVDPGPTWYRCDRDVRRFTDTSGTACRCDSSDGRFGARYGTTATYHSIAARNRRQSKVGGRRRDRNRFWITARNTTTFWATPPCCMRAKSEEFSPS